MPLTRTPQALPGDPRAAPDAFSRLVVFRSLRSGRALPRGRGFAFLEASSALVRTHGCRLACPRVPNAWHAQRPSPSGDAEKGPRESMAEPRGAGGGLLAFNPPGSPRSAPGLTSSSERGGLSGGKARRSQHLVAPRRAPSSLLQSRGGFFSTLGCRRGQEAASWEPRPRRDIAGQLWARRTWPRLPGSLVSAEAHLWRNSPGLSPWGGLSRDQQ